MARYSQTVTPVWPILLASCSRDPIRFFPPQAIKRFSLGAMSSLPPAHEDDWVYNLPWDGMIHSYDDIDDWDMVYLPLFIARRWLQLLEVLSTDASVTEEMSLVFLETHFGRLGFVLNRLCPLIPAQGFNFEDVKRDPSVRKLYVPESVKLTVRKIAG